VGEGVPLAGPGKDGLVLVGGSVDGLELHLLQARVGRGLYDGCIVVVVKQPSAAAQLRQDARTRARTLVS
jgi:hypothetical protein